MRTLTIMLGLFFCFFVSILQVSAGTHDRNSLYAKHHLRKLREATVRIIKSPDGDYIHCVRREKQPAFDHPLLKDHTFQEAPSYIPKELNESASSSLFGAQLWHRKGRCPQHTVPMRRPSISNLLAPHHARKYRHPNIPTSKENTPSTISMLATNPTFPHEYAIAQLDQDSIYGSYATLSAWKPFVGMPYEKSIAQLWLFAGNYTDNFLDSIEAGWAVDPHAYGDTNTRFFIYWTNDLYKSSGCLDLQCPGFVHVSNDILLGGTVAPISDFETQVEIPPILIWKDKVTMNWWLRIGGTDIGYWPSSLFKNGLQEKATNAQWGGEVINLSTGGLHTTTQMGSGRFLNEGFGKAAYARSLQILNSSYSLSPIPNSLLYRTTNPACYSISQASSKTWGSTFFFGGPGRNPHCQ